MRNLMPALVGVAALGLACRGSEPSTAEEKKAKGDQILHQMSDALAGRKTFSFTAEEVHERVKSGGQKVEERITHHVVVRRPNGFTSRRPDQGRTTWYDGQKLTVVSDTHKAWASGSAPPTLDQTMDYVAAVYDLRVPWADLLYSSPYEALISPDTTGGWVGSETVGAKECDHLAYQNPVVDWEIWVGKEKSGVCQLKIVYKQDPGQPAVRVTFKDLDLEPAVDDTTFTARIPEGYTRIRLARRDSDLRPEEAADAAPASSVPGTSAPPVSPGR